MFHKVLWQRMQGMVGFLITSLLQIYQVKNFVNRLRFDRIMAMSLWPQVTDNNHRYHLYYYNV